mgnify:FL=1
MKTSYGHKYSGSHLQIMERIKMINNVYDFSVDELNKNINLKNLLEYNLNFTGNLKNNDLANFLIKEKQIDVEKAFLLQYILKKYDNPNDVEIGNYLFGKNYSGDNQVIKEVAGQYKDIISYKAYEKYITKFEKILLLINDEDKNINKITQEEFLEVINDKIIDKRYKGSGFDITAVQMASIFRYSIQCERERLIKLISNKDSTEELRTKEISLIQEEYLNKAINACVSNLKLNLRNAIRLGEKAEKDIQECISLISKFNDLPKEEKSLNSLLKTFLNNEKVGFDIPMFGNIFKLNKSDALYSISEYHKEEALKEFPNLKDCFKYYDFLIMDSKSNEGEKVVKKKKKRQLASIKKIQDRFKFEVPDIKGGIALLNLAWNSVIERGLYEEKAKTNNYKTTANVNLNKDVFIEKHPELIQLINEQFNINLNEEINKKVSSYDILLNSGVKGLELGKTLKNKENVLLNVMACSAVLSKVLNVSIQDLFLNNSLGFAIGSRGRGNALAHFEKLNNLIHTTQKNEFASFAHEFAHAIDSAMGTVINNELSNMKYEQRKTNFAMERNLLLIDPSEFDNSKQISERILSSMSKLKTVFEKTDMKKASTKEDLGKIGAYWSKDIEMFARAFEVYVSDEITNLGLPEIGTHEKSYYSTSALYLSEKDKEVVYPIMKEIINLYLLRIC